MTASESETFAVLLERQYYFGEDDTDAEIIQALVNAHGGDISEYTSADYDYVSFDRLIPNEPYWLFVFACNSDGTPKLDEGKVNLSGTKTWVDYSNAFGVRPTAEEFKDGLTVTRIGNGDEKDITSEVASNLTVTDNNDGTYAISLTDMELWAPDGTAWRYRITEDLRGMTIASTANVDRDTAADYYTGTGSSTVTAGTSQTFSLTNRFTGTAAVEKDWVDGNDPYGLRPESVTVRLQARASGSGGSWQDADDFLKGYVEVLIDQLNGGVAALLSVAGASDMATSLVCDGIIAGVGGIITFLPNIFILFLALALLEDSGYMSRVAYVMDGIMGRLGLSGRAFIPMLLGFGCTVPAIMASRALENRRDRLKTMLVTPFMSCSARLPIYILFSEIFFPEQAMLAAYSMYLIGILMAILTAFVISRADKVRTENALLIELPEYKIPSGRTVFIYVWEKVKDFLTKAGTTIFVASVVMWALLNFGPSGYTPEMSESFGSMLGRFIVPLFAPIGLGFWQIVVALIAGISAKEVVVSSCAVLFGISNINSASGMDMLHGELLSIGFGPLNAVCLMVFCLLYVPCAATIMTIRKESGSSRWTVLSVLFQFCTAWVMSFLIYQIGSLLLA